MAKLGGAERQGWKHEAGQMAICIFSICTLVSTTLGIRSLETETGASVITTGFKN